MLTYAAIASPEAGIVSDRFADPGDLAAPGKPLLAIHDPTELELHASVGENLAAHLNLGQKLGVRVDAAHIDTEGTVREIVPRAEAASRSVLVKVTLPKQPPPAAVEDQLYIGMFGRLQIPVGQLDRIVIAAEAVQQIGQLDVVDVVAESDTTRTPIRTAGAAVWQGRRDTFRLACRRTCGDSHRRCVTTRRHAMPDPLPQLTHRRDTATSSAAVETEVVHGRIAAQRIKVCCRASWKCFCAAIFRFC